MTWKIGKITLDFNPQEIKLRGKRDLKKLGIVMGKPLFHDMGLSGEEVGLLGWLKGWRKYQLLKEQGQNGYFQPVYVYDCPSEYEGWYYQQEFGLTGKKGVVGSHEWSMKLWKVGSRANLVEQIFAAQSLITNTFQIDPGYVVIPLPVGSKNLLVNGKPPEADADVATFTRTGVEGDNPCAKVTGKTESSVRFDQALTDMFKGECKVFDTRGLAEADWYEVLDNEHVFEGEIVFQNNLLRIQTPASGAKLSHKIWTGAAWDDLEVHFETTGETNPPVSFAFKKISREEIDVTFRWENGLWRHYVLRRGQPFFEYSDSYLASELGTGFKLIMYWDTEKHEWVAWQDPNGQYEQNAFTVGETDLLLAGGEANEMRNVWFAMYKKQITWNGQFIAMSDRPIDGKVTVTAGSEIDKILLEYSAEPRIFFGYKRGDYTGTPSGILNDMATDDASVLFRAYEAIHDHNFTRLLTKREWIT